MSGTFMGAEADVVARSRVRGELAANLFVEAGAGTGKTAELVRRIIGLVAGGAELPRIAAITFTEAAAAELRERIRLALEEGVVDPAAPQLSRERWRAALASIDEAPLSTLHAFAQRLLASHPLAARLPPGFELVDANEMAGSFDRRWSRFLGRLYDPADPAARHDLRLAIDLGLSSDHLQAVAGAFHQNWDLLIDPAPLPPVAPADPAAVFAAIDRATAMAVHCSVSADALLARLAELHPLRAEIARSCGEERAMAAALLAWRPHGVRIGRAPHWKCSIEAVRTALEGVGQAREDVLDALRRRVLHRLLAELAAFTLEGADERRRQGVLEFHDLLVRARSLLRSPEVRRCVQADFSHILVDEFQDTDPLQVELAVLLAVPTDVDDPGEWWEAPRIGGRLFFVGDPKQSIYRFRRADIGLYAEVRERLGTDRVGLVRNWRSLPSIIDFVNAVFGPMLQAGGSRQAPWADLVAGRAHPGDRTGTVAVLGGEGEGRAEAVRAVEAGELVRVVEAIEAQQWQVVDRSGGSRPARFDDVALLLPSRTALPAIEQAFGDARIPYRVESRSLVWATQEVRDLLSVLRAVDDPTDGVAVVAALRSVGMGCSDEDLYEWKRAGGRWRPDAAVPDGLGPDHPVVSAMADLSALARRRHWVRPSELIDSVIRVRRLLELAYAKPRQREAWNRVRFVAEQARAWEEGGGAALRAFVDWAEAQADQDAQGLESVVPDPDDDAVRILTIHASKGLEFPIVVLAGLSAGRNRAERAQVLWGQGGRPQVRCGPAATGFTTSGYAEARSEDEELVGHELARLLYVAATRARDHLVVSLHRPRRGGAATAAGRLAAFVEGASDHVNAFGIDDLESRWPTLAGNGVARRGPSVGGQGTPRGAVVEGGSVGVRLSSDAVWADLARSEELHRLAVDAAAGPAAVAGTAIADLPDPSGLPLAVARADGPASEGDDPGPRAPRPGSGTAFGIAVHEVLEAAPFGDDPGDLAGLAQQAAVRADIPDRGRQVEAASRRALSANVLDCATGGRSWREVFVGADIDGTVVEGFIDLVIEAPSGELVIVDWKTDAVGGRAVMNAKTEQYSLQLAAYAEALERTTGRRVTKAVIVFCGGDRLHEAEVPDLPGRRQQVRDRLKALRTG